MAEAAGAGPGDPGSPEAQSQETPPEEQAKSGGDAKAWDLVVCDEAHRMKNISTLLGKSLRRVRARSRLLLTGTPIQNVLQDLWAQMDFAQPGLLGNHQTFVKHFSDPIDRGSIRGAGPFALALKKHLAARLRDLIAPHLLRRTKVGTGLQGAAEKDEAQKGAAVAEDAWLFDEGLETKQLPPKRETVIWLIPSDEQTAIYKQALETSELISDAAAKGKLGIEAFRAIGLLKRLCNHPLLALPMPKKES
jgi:DNA excision repair protein ERCC-6